MVLSIIFEKVWPRRDLNTQPSDLESDALPLRHEVLYAFLMEKAVIAYITGRR